MKLKKHSLKKWKKWLKIVLSPENPEKLTKDECYVHEAFLELIKKVQKIKNYGKKKTYNYRT